MPVGEMLMRISARELTEWMAYEEEFGALDQQWDRNVLASIQELLQQSNHLFVGSNTPEGKPNNYPEPKPIPRPWNEVEDPIE